MLEKYIASVKQDGAEVKTLKAEGADEMVVSSNIGLFDVVFRKGNSLAGANGADQRHTGRGIRPRACQDLAGQVPTLESSRVELSALYRSTRLAGHSTIHGTLSGFGCQPQDRKRLQGVRRTTRDQGSNHERKTDPDPDQEPGAARRGQPGRPAVLAPAVRRSGRRLRPGGRWGRRGRPLLRDHWGMEGVKPPPPVRLKDYSVDAAGQPAEHGRRAIQPGAAPRSTPPRKRS